MAGESPVSIALRRLARARPDIRPDAVRHGLAPADGLPVQPAHPLPGGQRPTARSSAPCRGSTCWRHGSATTSTTRAGSSTFAQGPAGPGTATATTSIALGEAPEVARPARSAAVGTPDPAALPVDPRPARRDGQRDGLEHLSRGRRDGRSIATRSIAPRLHSFMLSVVDDDNGTPRPSIALELVRAGRRRRRLASGAGRTPAGWTRGPQPGLSLVDRRVPRGHAADRHDPWRRCWAVRRGRVSDQAAADRLTRR